MLLRLDVPERMLILAFVQTFEDLPTNGKMFQGTLLDEVRIHVCEFAAKFARGPCWLFYVSTLRK